MDLTALCGMVSHVTGEPTCLSRWHTRIGCPHVSTVGADARAVTKREVMHFISTQDNSISAPRRIGPAINPAKKERKNITRDCFSDQLLPRWRMNSSLSPRSKNKQNKRLVFHSVFTSTVFPTSTFGIDQVNHGTSTGHPRRGKPWRPKIGSIISDMTQRDDHVCHILPPKNQASGINTFP